MQKFNLAQHYDFASAAKRLALTAGRTGETPPQTSTIASKPASYHQGEALSAARFVGHRPEALPICRPKIHPQ
jgi:hypothetical protein